MSAEWPALPLAEWQPTYETLHLWTQVIGKVRLARTPVINHWWNTTLYLNARGLTTSAIPNGFGAFEVAFDFIDHRLIITTSAGAERTIALQPMPSAAFFESVMRSLSELEIDVKVQPLSCELPRNIRLDRDVEHASYDPQWANRWWRIMLAVHNVMQEFRARFVGKCSPVHFFWGSFDLAVSRFNGQRAPERDDPLMSEAYSHEVSSAGFWPGSGSILEPAFYAYHTPAPEGYERAAVRPAAARWDGQLGEFILPYEAVRTAASPRETLLEFLQSAYEAGADLAGWKRDSLERS